MTEIAQTTDYGVYLGLYTILPLPILYGVWQTKGGRGGVVYCAIYVQQYYITAGNSDGRGQ